MKIIILGAGLIGLNSAYFLKKSGYDVLVVDRQSDVALETSFANGGQISVGYSEPWANKNNLKKIFHELNSIDSPIYFHPSTLLKNPRWFSEFVFQCSDENYKKNVINMLKLSNFSRDTLLEIRKEYSLKYNQQTNGIITYYSTQEDYEKAFEATEFFRSFNCHREMKTYAETLALEPALKQATFPIYGSDYVSTDESGDAHLYTKELKRICKKLGVEFEFNCNVVDTILDYKTGCINGLQVLKTNPKNGDCTPSKITGDMFVCALGSYSKIFLNTLGIGKEYLLYPVKGYSITYDITKPEIINNISLTDSTKKTVLTRLGNQLRVAGTAEFNDFDTQINLSRIEPIMKRVKEIFPEGLNHDNPKIWTGLRPTTPFGSPYIGATRIHNLYVNFGHGTLGFTMAAGSGKLLAQHINKKDLYGKDF